MALNTYTWVNCQFPKVFVKGNQDALFGERTTKQRFVAGITRPFAGPFDIIARGTKLNCSVSANARIQQQLHSIVPVSIASGSIRS